MKRDMELARKLLFRLESRTSMKAALTFPIGGYDDVAVRYHLLLLAQAKLIDFEPELTNTGRIIRPHVLGLDWNGHEFLDAVRSEKVWRKLLKYTKDKGGALPFDLLGSCREASRTIDHIVSPNPAVNPDAPSAWPRSYRVLKCRRAVARLVGAPVTLYRWASRRPTHFRRTHV